MLSLSHFGIVLLHLNSLCLASAALDQSVTIYAWPVAASSPQELARITYNQDSLSTPTISDFKAPIIEASDTDSYIRVGLYDPSTKAWRGVITSSNSFDSKFQQQISLHLDPDLAPWHVGFSAYPKPKPGPIPRRKGEELELVPQVVAEIVPPKAGPTPHLNRPVLLRPDGKIEEKEPEKTFLQKYWWAILIFLAVQVMAGGGGGAEK